MHLREWAKGFRVVEGDSSHTARVRLLTPDDEVWHTWEQGELNETEWPEDAQRYLDALASEYPLGKYSVEFLAEDEGGAVRSRVKRTIQGRNAGAKRGQQNDITAVARAMESLATQMSRYMEFQHESQARYQRQVEDLLDANGRLANQIIEERENGVRNASGASEILAGAIAQHIGPVLTELPGVMRFLTGAVDAKPSHLVSVPLPKKG